MTSPPEVLKQETAVDPSLVLVGKVPHHDGDTEAQQDQSTPTEERRPNDVKKWYCRPPFLAAIIVLSVCIVVAAIAVPIAIMFQGGNAPTSVNDTDPFQIACNFLSIPDVKECRSTVQFENEGTTGSTIPSELGLLTQLTYLSLYDKQLTSTIPSELSLLTQLTQLHVYNNVLTGSIPSEISLLTQLQYLSFNDNELTGSISNEIGLLTQLAGLSLENNALTGSIPSEIGLLTQLTGYLRLNNNELSGTIPSSLCPLTYGGGQGLTIHIDCGEITCACCTDTEYGFCV